MSFSNSEMHLVMLAIPFLCCQSFTVCSMLRAISRTSRSNNASPRYSPEYMVFANCTAPQGNFGKSLKILGSFDFGLGTEAALGTLGIGGGMTGMVMPLIPGIVAGQLVGTTLLKSQGMLLGAVYFFGGLSFLVFFSFLIFFGFLSFLGLEDESESESESSESSESELYLSLSFFFFFSSLSFFLSFFFSLSLSLCFFLSPINLQQRHYSSLIHINMLPEQNRHNIQKNQHQNIQVNTSQGLPSYFNDDDLKVLSLFVLLEGIAQDRNAGLLKLNEWKF